jgi:type I restriction enzyme S subunit
LVPGPHVEGGVPLVRVADLDLVSPNTSPEKHISEKVDTKFTRTRVRGGEIFMAVVGSIGKLGVAPASWKGANIARALCRILPNKNISKAYILMLLQTDFMQKGFQDDTRVLAQPTLNIGLIRSALTPIPPLAEQHRIVAKVDQLMALCDQLKASLATAQTTQLNLADSLVEQAIG